jgi:hypothetical protein
LTVLIPKGLELPEVRPDSGISLKMNAFMKKPALPANAMASRPHGSLNLSYV